MMTPQEVQEKKFEKAVFGGYDMIGVDEFLERLTADYAGLYKENAVLKSKLKVLVDTVEEYRSVDEAMRRTLFTAQKMADDLTREAKAKSEEIVRRANADAAESVRRLRAENEMELTRFQMLKEQTEQFTQRLTEAYTKQLETVATMKKQVLSTQPYQKADDMAQAAQEISASVQATLNREQPVRENPPPPREPQADFEISVKGGGERPFEESPEEKIVSSRPRFEFPNLQSQFGQQYSGHGGHKD